MKYLNPLRFTLAAACFFIACTAQAALFKVDISAAGFTSISEAWDLGYTVTTPPQDAISGYITFQADSFGANIDAITGVSLLIDGHQYQANEIGGTPIAVGYLFGGLLNDINGVTSGTNDFWVHAFSTIGGNFFYSSTSASDSWFSYEYTYSYTKVPEPSALVLLFAGLLLVGVKRATRRN